MSEFCVKPVSLLLVLVFKVARFSLVKEHRELVSGNTRKWELRMRAMGNLWKLYLVYGVSNGWECNAELTVHIYWTQRILHLLYRLK